MENKTVIIVGAGVSGICAGIKLKKAGMNNFIIFEKNDNVGGTWYNNKYPNVECDVESHLYSFSFELWSEWDRVYSDGMTILCYLEHCCTKYGIYEHIVLKSEVKEARWCEFSNSWNVDIISLPSKDEVTYFSQYLIVSYSSLNVPNIPYDVNKYQGKVLHTTTWDSSIELKNKKIALIGNAASGIQCVIDLVSHGKEVHIFQRTPNWVLPKFNRVYSSVERWLLNFYLIKLIYRIFLYFFHEFILHTALVKNSWSNKLLTKEALKYLKTTVKDEETRKRLTPTYPLGCKRILVSDNYYDIFNKPSVKLHTERIKEIDAQGIVLENGTKIETDVIVFASGFDLGASIMKIKIIGEGGKRLQTDTPCIYGVYHDGFPNCFTLLGKNSGSGHTSMIIYVESQVDFIVKQIKSCDTFTIPSIKIQKYNAEIQQKMNSYVWLSCNSWYLTDGKNNTLYPGSSLDFRNEMSKKL